MLWIPNLLALLAALQSAPVPDSVEEAEKNIIDASRTIQSLSATITNEETSRTPTGDNTRVEIRRNIQWVQDQDGFRYRSDSATTVTRLRNGRKEVEQSTATTVSDGRHVVALTEQNGVKSATQRNADITERPDMRTLFETLRQDYVLKRLPDIKVGFDDCYAIQLLPRKREGSDILQTMMYFRKDIGLDVRTVAYDKQNEPMFTSATTNIRINEKIPAERFRLVLPDDVELKVQTARP